MPNYNTRIEVTEFLKEFPLYDLFVRLEFILTTSESILKANANVKKVISRESEDIFKLRYQI